MPRCALIPSDESVVVSIPCHGMDMLARFNSVGRHWLSSMGDPGVVIAQCRHGCGKAA